MLQVVIVICLVVSLILPTFWISQSNVSALIDMKLEKHKNLREESGFYWREIFDGTLKFDRIECEVRILIDLTFLPYVSTKKMFQFYTYLTFEWCQYMKRKVTTHKNV